jgi:hypothetical protein
VSWRPVESIQGGGAPAAQGSDRVLVGWDAARFPCSTSRFLGVVDVPDGITCKQLYNCENVTYPTALAPGRGPTMRSNP